MHQVPVGVRHEAGAEQLVSLFTDHGVPPGGMGTAHSIRNMAAASFYNPCVPHNTVYASTTYSVIRLDLVEGTQQQLPWQPIHCSMW